MSTTRLEAAMPDNTVLVYTGLSLSEAEGLWSLFQADGIAVNLRGEPSDG